MTVQEAIYYLPTYKCRIVNTMNFGAPKSYKVSVAKLDDSTYYPTPISLFTIESRIETKF